MHIYDRKKHPLKGFPKSDLKATNVAVQPASSEYRSGAVSQLLLQLGNNNKYMIELDHLHPFSLKKEFSTGEWAVQNSMFAQKIEWWELLRVLTPCLIGLLFYYRIPLDPNIFFNFPANLASYNFITASQMKDHEVEVVHSLFCFEGIKLTAFFAYFLIRSLCFLLLMCSIARWEHFVGYKSCMRTREKRKQQ